jgi:hypothetical protein
MKTYNSDFDESLFFFGEKKNNEKLLIKNNWVIVDDSADGKSLYYFRKNNELFITTNGILDKGMWYCFGKNKLVIEENGKSFLFELSYLNNDYNVLKVDSWDEYAFFVNEKSWNKKPNSIMEIYDYIREKKLNRSYKYKVFGIILPSFGIFLYFLGFLFLNGTESLDGGILMFVSIIVMFSAVVFDIPDFMNFDFIVALLFYIYFFGSFFVYLDDNYYGSIFFQTVDLILSIF